MDSNKNLNRFIRDKKIWILSALVLILMVTVFGPILSLLNQRLKASQNLKQELTKLETKKITLEGIDENLVAERVTKMEDVFPSVKPVVQLLSSLSQLSGQRNLSFGGVTLRPGSLSEQPSEKKNPLQDLQFDFEVGGSFDNISLFLTDLEAAAPIMKIEKVGLAIKTNPLFTREQTIVTASISVSAFYQSPPETLGSVSAPVELLTKNQEALLNRLFNFISFEQVVPTAPTGKVDLFSGGL